MQGIRTSRNLQGIEQAAAYTRSDADLSVELVEESAGDRAIDTKRRGQEKYAERLSRTWPLNTMAPHHGPLCLPPSSTALNLAQEEEEKKRAGMRGVVHHRPRPIVSWSRG